MPLWNWLIIISGPVFDELRRDQSNNKNPRKRQQNGIQPPDIAKKFALFLHHALPLVGKSMMPDWGSGQFFA
jgi:hypothetical protein